MTQDRRSLHLKFLGTLSARVVPARLQRRVIDHVLNKAFHIPLTENELDFLAGSVVRVRVNDLGLDWLFTLRDERITALDSNESSDVCISGNAVAFILLATRRADPDTLFFQRRLSVEGDTELGLAVKNTLDGMDWDELPLLLRNLLQIIGALIAGIKPLLPDNFIIRNG